MLKNRDFFRKTVSGRFGKVFWILLSSVLMFAGPTYLLYALRKYVPFPYLELLSIVIFAIGLYILLQVYEEKQSS